MPIPHNNPASGAVDGVNKIFKTQVKVGPASFTEVPFTANTTAVFYNGKALTGEHTELLGGTTGEVELDFAPLAGDPSDPLDGGDTVRIWFLDTTPEGLVSEFLVDLEVVLELEEASLSVTLSPADELSLELNEELSELEAEVVDDQALAVVLDDPEVVLVAAICVIPS